jgi:hypothetical protein
MYALQFHFVTSNIGLDGLVARDMSRSSLMWHICIAQGLVDEDKFLSLEQEHLSLKKEMAQKESQLRKCGLTSCSVDSTLSHAVLPHCNALHAAARV